MEKMPIMIAGNSELAARPKAKATVWAANPGGFMPSQVATTIANAIDTRAASSSPFSVISGLNVFLIRSWLTADEIASSRPAAVDSAAARPPAAIRAITQPGRPAISGFASTRMSWLKVTISLPCQPRSAATAANSVLPSL